MKPSAVIWSWGWWKPGCWELNCVDVMTRLINVEMKAALKSQRGIFSIQWMLFQIWKDLQTRNLNHSFFAVGGDCCAGQPTANVRFCKKKTHRTLRLDRYWALALSEWSDSFEVLSRVPQRESILQRMCTSLQCEAWETYLETAHIGICIWSQRVPLHARSAHPSFAFQGGKFASTIGRRCARCASISQGFVIIIFIRSIWAYKPPPP